MGGMGDLGAAKEAQAALGTRAAQAVTVVAPTPVALVTVAKAEQAVMES